MANKIRKITKAGIQNVGLATIMYQYMNAKDRAKIARIAPMKLGLRNDFLCTCL